MNITKQFTDRIEGIIDKVYRESDSFKETFCNFHYEAHHYYIDTVRLGRDKLYVGFKNDHWGATHRQTVNYEDLQMWL